MTDANCIISVYLDEKTIAHRTYDLEQERKVAIYDLLQKNYFKLEGNIKNEGRYSLKLSIQDNRLIFNVDSSLGKHLGVIGISLSPFKKIIKDYWVLCESYFSAIKQSSPSQIETIDMARRSLHNEGSKLMIERLSGKVELDENTARRLFTLLCVLHLR